MNGEGHSLPPSTPPNTSQSAITILFTSCLLLLLSAVSCLLLLLLLVSFPFSRGRAHASPGALLSTTNSPLHSGYQASLSFKDHRQRPLQRHKRLIIKAFIEVFPRLNCATYEGRRAARGGAFMTIIHDGFVCSANGPPAGGSGPGRGVHPHSSSPTILLQTPITSHHIPMIKSLHSHSPHRSNSVPITKSFITLFTLK